MGTKMKAVFCLGFVTLLIVLVLSKGNQDNLKTKELKKIDRLTRDTIQEEGKGLSQRRKKRNTEAKKRKQKKKKKGKSVRRKGKKKGASNGKKKRRSRKYKKKKDKKGKISNRRRGKKERKTENCKCSNNDVQVRNVTDTKTENFKSYKMASNRLRQIRRIKKKMRQCQNKATKAATAFTAAASVLKGLVSNRASCSGNTSVSSLSNSSATISNCSETAANLCDFSSLGLSEEELDKCETLLQTSAQEIQQCLDDEDCDKTFDKVDQDCIDLAKDNLDLVVNVAGNCTSPTVEGSFSNCQQINKGVAQFVQDCQANPMTTKSTNFRNLHQKMMRNL